MQKRDGRLVRSIASGEIFVLIIATIAFAFVLSESNLVQAQLPRGLPPGSTVKDSSGTIRTVTDWSEKNSDYSLRAPDGRTMNTYTSNSEFSFLDSGTTNIPNLREANAPAAGPAVDESGAKGPAGPAGAIAPTAALSLVKPGEGTIWKNLGTGKRYTAQGDKVFEETDKGWERSSLTKEQLQADLNAGGMSEQYKSDLPFIGGILPAGGWSHLGSGVIYAGMAYAAGQMIGSLFGWQAGQTRALSQSLGAGVMAYKMAMAFGDTGFSTSTALSTAAPWIGLGVAVAVFIITYRKERTETKTFTCLPYEAPVGGAKCEECNKDSFRPCTEYRCKALGQACELLNKESPGKEKCAWKDPKDVNSPTITPWTGALLPAGLSYISDTSVRPPALGVRVVKGQEGCLQAFTPLEFGIVTNEPAQCKIDWNNTMKYDDMRFYFGESSLFEYNHTQRMKLPGPSAFNASTGAAESPIFKNDGTTQLYVRCKDANGNENVDAYSVRFCVDKSPDTTPPFIEDTSIASGNPVRYNSDKVPVAFFVNEPAQCKWGITPGQPFDNMANSMDCVTDAADINSRLSYTCMANLTGIKNQADNTFYIRCKDQPTEDESKRNVMVQDYVYVLKGSQPLNILKVGPNETVKGSTESVTVDLTVETDDGAEQGKAYCFISPFGTNGTYVEMAETNDYKHKQTLQLITGDYTYYFRCTDLGGNSAEAKTSFSVFSDKEAPQVARVYREEGTGLKVVTNEDAECRYSLKDCNFVFSDGLALIYSNPSIKTNSYAEWKPNTIYYIKCKDLYGNEPNPNECSVIAKPVENTMVAA